MILKYWYLLVVLVCICSIQYPLTTYTLPCIIKQKGYCHADTDAAAGSYRPDCRR